MALLAYTVTILSGAAATAIGADAGAFTIRVSSATKFGGSDSQAEAAGFPFHPDDPPHTVTLEAGESIWAFAPATPSQPTGTPVQVFVLKND